MIRLSFFLSSFFVFYLFSIENEKISSSSSSSAGKRADWVVKTTRLLLSCSWAQVRFGREGTSDLIRSSAMIQLPSVLSSAQIETDKVDVESSLLIKLHRKRMDGWEGYEVLHQVVSNYFQHFNYCSTYWTYSGEQKTPCNSHATLERN